MFAPLGHVATAVGAQALTVRQLQGQVALGGLLWVVQVTEADAGTDDEQFADGVLRHRLQVVIENQHLTVGNRCAKSAVTVTRFELASGNQHRRFGGAVQVMQLALTGQLLDDEGLADVATGHYFHALQLLQRQDAQQRWRQERVGQLPAADQRHQLQRIAALGVVGHHQFGALQQRRKISISDESKLSEENCNTRLSARNCT